MIKLETGITLDHAGKIPVEDVNIGDRVRTADGGCAEVNNIYTGPEEMQRYIRAEGMQQELRVSLDHPVMTRNGWVQAKYLSTSDEILTETGEYRCVEEYYTEPCNGEMLNLELADKHEFYANGYVVGDALVENGLNHSPIQAEQLPLEIREELQKFLNIYG